MRTIEHDAGRGARGVDETGRTARGAGRARWLAIAVTALAMAGTACGARWNSEQRAQVLSRGVRADTAVVDGAPGPRDGTARAAGTQVTTPPSSSGGATSGGGGATDPTGSSGTAGDTGGAAAAGPGPGGLPCAAPSDAPGVEDGRLTIGAISSMSGPVPGLGASAAAAVRAYVAHRNADGGVCGREVVLREADDGTDISRYRAVLREMNPAVLGIAGGFAVGDIGSEELITEFGIPIINSPTGRTGELPMVFDINPDFPQPDMRIGKYAYLYERGARKVSMTYIAVDQSRIEANIQRALMEAAGLEVVHVNELPLATLSYDSAARAAANSGANYLWFIADTNGQASMARSVHDTGHDWLFKEFSYTTYGTSFVEQAGDEAAEGVTSWLRSLPTEEAASNQAMATYVEWMDRVAPGLPMDLFSIDSWVSAKAFLQAVEALPGPITRDAVVQQLASIQSYDADGMFAPITLGQDLSQGCFMGMIVRGGRWQRLAPEGGGYLC